ncbi:hypothetical protein C8039_09370 [Halogeometricum sp. wsp3]|nr:hypothetical protein C8039_09370 [Halogeometricum sp. wsp3]
MLGVLSAETVSVRSSVLNVAHLPLYTILLRRHKTRRLTDAQLRDVRATIPELWTIITCGRQLTEWVRMGSRFQSTSIDLRTQSYAIFQARSAHRAALQPLSSQRVTYDADGRCNGFQSVDAPLRLA